MKKLFAIMAVALALQSSAYARFPHGSTASSGLTQFSPLKVGGGGFTTGISVSPDGLTILSRVDVYGEYIWNSSTSQWDQLYSDTRMPAGSQKGLIGGVEVVSAPSNSAIIYAYFNSGLFRRTDRGASFIKLANFTSIAGGNPSAPFAFSRFNGPKMAVDPINPDVLYVGTPADGVLVSTNATTTATFSAVATVPTLPAGYAGKFAIGYTIAFDKNGGNNGTSTNIVYISDSTNGVYKATTPGGSFSLMSGSPTASSRMVVSPNSVLYVTDDTNLYKFTSGTWTTYNSAATGINPHSVAIDVNNSASASTERVVIGNSGGNVSVTTNSGTAWTGSLGFTRVATDVPWLAETNEFFMSNGDMQFDPTKSNVLMFAEGIGVWTASPVNTTFAWTSQTKGIESLQPNGVVASPNTTRTPTLYGWDRPFFYSANQDVYPSVQLPNALLSISMGWGVDWATSDGATLAGISYFSVPSVDLSGTSSDNGQTWLPFPNASTPTTSLTTSAGSLTGSQTLTFASGPPPWIEVGMVLSNSTHPASLSSPTYVLGINTGSHTISIYPPVTATAVSSGDTIVVNLPSSPVVKAYPTNAGTASGAVLHFASLATNAVHTGMQVSNLSNSGTINIGGGAPTIVKSVSGGDVTLSDNVLGAIASGDVIMFYDAIGGSIAAQSPSNIVWVPSNNSSYPYYTTDSGATWNPIDIAGVPRAGTGSVTSGSAIITGLSFNTSNLVVGAKVHSYDGNIPDANVTVLSIDSPSQIHVSTTALGTNANAVLLFETGWGDAYYKNMRVVAADRVTADKFYLFNYVTGKVYASTNKGVTWAPVNVTPANISTTYTLSSGQNMAIQSVPGQAGNLFLSGANISSDNSQFIRSTDGGVTWTAVTNITGVNAFGFGKAAPGQSYPAVYIYGKKSGTLSVWRSDDNCVTWVDLGTADPVGSLDTVTALDGDKNVYGKVYGAFSGNGWFYGTIH